jgi:hypothetical protein
LTQNRVALAFCAVLPGSKNFKNSKIYRPKPAQKTTAKNISQAGAYR